MQLRRPRVQMETAPQVSISARGAGYELTDAPTVENARAPAPAMLGARTGPRNLWLGRPMRPKNRSAASSAPLPLPNSSALLEKRCRPGGSSGRGLMAPGAQGIKGISTESVRNQNRIGTTATPDSSGIKRINTESLRNQRRNRRRNQNRPERRSTPESVPEPAERGPIPANSLRRVRGAGAPRDFAGSARRAVGVQSERVFSGRYPRGGLAYCAFAYSWRAV